jgi:hypothetical protein
MADTVGSKIEINIQFQVPAVIFSGAVKAKGSFVTRDKETAGRQMSQLSSVVI